MTDYGCARRILYYTILIRMNTLSRSKKKKLYMPVALFVNNIIYNITVTIINVYPVTLINDYVNGLTDKTGRSMTGNYNTAKYCCDENNITVVS